MLLSFLSALGGVGLFLIGMLLLTDGLKSIAGRRMRDILARFTSTPATGAVTGAATTAIIQSSSATTVAAVGFVASGLLTFPQAIGIIFGANVGTTITGWLVAILGFKLDLGQIALPFVFLGAIMRIGLKGRLALAGQALAGFSLIFIGIEHMKDGLDAFGGVVTPTDFPPDTVFGRLQLVATGILITLVTQSSSAGVATALAALGAGAINFPQAAALVIGMDIGTTFTAVLATLGGGTMAKRTGFAHVIYNVLTGMMALFLLTPFQTVAGSWIDGGDPQIALVAFHSFFNLLGVSLILPFAKPFARLVEFLIPHRGSELTKALDPLVLSDPAAAVMLARQTVGELSVQVVAHLRGLLGAADAGRDPVDPETLSAALRETRDYLDSIEVASKDVEQIDRIKSMLHILDHLGRLLYRCGQSERIGELSRDAALQRLTAMLEKATRAYADPQDPVTCAALLDRLRAVLRKQREHGRARMIASIATKSVSSETVWLRLDALRWLHRVAYHLWRIRVHLNVLRDGDHLSVPSDEEARLDIEQD